MERQSTGRIRGEFMERGRRKLRLGRFMTQRRQLSRRATSGLRQRPICFTRLNWDGRKEVRQLFTAWLPRQEQRVWLRLSYWEVAQRHFSKKPMVCTYGCPRHLPMLQRIHSALDSRASLN